MAACDAVRLQPGAHQGHRASQPGASRRSRTASTTRPSASLKLAIQTDPTYDIAHYNLGKVYQKQRKWDKAIEAFEGAAQRAPDNANYSVRPRRGVPRGQADGQGRGGAQEGDRARRQAVQGALAAGAGLHHARAAQGGRRGPAQGHRGQPAAGQAVRGAGPPVPGLRRRQGGRAGVLGVRAGQRDERRVLQRPRSGAQGPEAVRAGDRASSRRRSSSSPGLTTRSTTPA